MRLLSLLLLGLAALASAGNGVRGADTRELEEPDSEMLRQITVPTDMVFSFDREKSKNPNSAELDVLLENTKDFFKAQFAKTSDNVVGIKITEIQLPLHVQPTFHLRFFTNILVKPECNWIAPDTFEVMSGFDFNEDYLINYVRKVTPMSDWEKNTFVFATSISFNKAVGIQRTKYQAFRNFESEGKYKDTSVWVHRNDASIYGW